MNFLEKAKIRMEKWIDHNDHHNKEYEDFARQLAREGKKESSQYITEMISIITKSNDSLKKALDALDYNPKEPS